jgi:hypothetical protein
MIEPELTEALQELDDKLDLIRQYSFDCSNTLQRILMEILAMQKQERPPNDNR